MDLKKLLLQINLMALLSTHSLMEEYLSYKEWLHHIIKDGEMLPTPFLDIRNQVDNWSKEDSKA